MMQRAHGRELLDYYDNKQWSFSTLSLPMICTDPCIFTIVAFKALISFRYFYYSNTMTGRRRVKTAQIRSGTGRSTACWSHRAQESCNLGTLSYEPPPRISAWVVPRNHNLSTLRSSSIRTAHTRYIALDSQGGRKTFSADTSFASPPEFHPLIGYLYRPCGMGRRLRSIVRPLPPPFDENSLRGVSYLLPTITYLSTISAMRQHDGGSGAR
ncbi:hypothetical protein F5B21DRAFT_495650 [Xylaria acuta]|nr:hypothetical protein F5B21DRAFT_495650 [Xylaria acuta]